jgi:hypothetical protein
MTIRVGKQYNREPYPWCEQVLAKFGQNQYGENIYRMVWSEARFDKVGGTWLIRLDPEVSSHITKIGNFTCDTNPVVAEIPGYRWFPTYPGRQCWVLEKWLPAPCSEAEWYLQHMEMSSGLCLLGPYPDYGFFHTCRFIEMQGEYMEITATVIEYYCRQIEAAKHYTKTERRVAKELLKQRAQRDYDNRFDAIFDDAQDAGGTGNLFMAASGPSTVRKKLEDVNFVTTEQLKEWGLPVPDGSGGRHTFSQLT